MPYDPSRLPCVYLIAEEGTLDVCKIGMTQLLARRLSGIQTANWRKLEIIHAFQVIDIEVAARVELQMLELFRPRIIRGEWIKASPSEVCDAIKEHLNLFKLPVIDLMNVTESSLNVLRFVMGGGGRGA